VQKKQAQPVNYGAGLIVIVNIERAPSSHRERRQP